MRFLAVVVAFGMLIGCVYKQKNANDSAENMWTHSSAKEELGYHLYFEKRFSADNSISCNSCHNIVNRANGAEASSVSTGINGQKGGRNSPTVWNAKFLSVQFWDGRAKNLAEQAAGPITNPIEMGMKDHKAAIAKIANIKGYQDLFQKAYPKQKDPMTIGNAVEAIAAFEKTLVSLNSAYDRKTMSPLAQQGYKEFQSVGCVACHSGAYFAGPKLPEGTGFYMKFPTFPDKALEKKYGFSKDEGRFEVTQKSSDKHMFRVPSLRNVATTAPYFHNGSVADLPTAVRVMGKTQLNKDLSDKQVKALVAFLESLTGEKPLIKEPEALM